MGNFSNFGSEYNGSYVVVIDGNHVVFSDCNQKLALCYAMKSVKRGHYVEVWYQRRNGKCELIKFWN